MKQKGFTLIELMVVISIISLLSSVIMASLNGARAKAVLAAEEEFQAGIDHTIRDQLVGEWLFNNSSTQATQLADSSGFANNAVCAGSCTYMSTAGYNGQGAFNLNGSGYLSTGFGMASGGQGTINLWVNPSSIGTIGILQSSNGGSNIGLLARMYSSGQLDVGVHSGGDITFNNFFSTAGKWYMITIVWNGSAITVYQNGTKMTSSSNGVNTSVFIQNLGIGQGENGVGNFTGLIDDVRVYSTGYGLSEIERLYAGGLTKHLAMK